MSVRIPGQERFGVQLSMDRQYIDNAMFRLEYNKQSGCYTVEDQQRIEEADARKRRNTTMSDREAKA